MRPPRLASCLVVLASLAVTACGSSGDGSTTAKPFTASTTSGQGAGTQGSGGQGSGGEHGSGGQAGAGGSPTTTAAGGSGTGGGTTGQGGGTGAGGQAGVGGQGGSGGCSKDAECDDGLYCDGVETCAGGVCQPGAAPACDDGVACTKDACDEAAKACAHSPDHAACDDQIACDGVETCDAKAGCVSGPAPSCDDGVACTVDACDAQTGACTHVPSDLACDDGVYCDGVEHCDPANGDANTGCVAGEPVACDDGIACTKDSCSEMIGKCQFAPDASACQDKSFCNGAELCLQGVGCVPGAPPSCDDQRSCTADACSDDLAACTHTPSNAACSDGLFCNGVEICDPAGPQPTGCLPGTPVACATDGIACTKDDCVEATKACGNVADNALCDKGEFCVPGKGGCTPAKPCVTDLECDDGDDCNGKETCQVTCAPGKPVACDDGVACTVDSCNPVGGACIHAPNDDFCDNGLACDGAETCDPNGGCKKASPVDCNDGVACTFDFCAEPAGTCVHTPNDGACDDGLLCNGNEVCAADGCKPGKPYVCDDGIACTVDVCDPLLDGCRSTAHDELCGCGQTCDAQKGGCGNFCVVATCQGKVYQCGNCTDDDGDCKVDSADSQCLGPCDNSESDLSIAIPGANQAPCKADCYFDGDTGAGNDGCYWSHACDPREVAPSYYPEGDQCKYDPATKIPGANMTCAQAAAGQSQTCVDYCGPLVPNGCDCFGGCDIVGAPTPVWLGSTDANGAPSCTTDTLADPNECKPCTQVPACLNTCKHCELCVGKPELPADCNGVVECPPGMQSCGLPGDPACPVGFSCVTGCCPANPQ